MTPAATTPAAQPQQKQAARKSQGHRRQLRSGAVPTAPRRVSSPVRKRAVAPSAAPARARRPASSALAFIQALPDHRLLDRLIRGRVWIPLLGLLLAGIVAMQVEVLKLGASIGRSLQRTTMLQSRNEQLRESVASLADDQRIERLAAGMGMVMPAPPSVDFLSVGSGRHVGQAIANVHAPNPQSFLSQLASSNAAAQAATGAPTGPSSSSTTAAGLVAASSTSAAGTTTSSTATPTGVATGTGSTAPTTASVAAPAPVASPTGTSSMRTGASTSGGAAIGSGR